MRVRGCIFKIKVPIMKTKGHNFKNKVPIMKTQGCNFKILKIARVSNYKITALKTYC